MASLPCGSSSDELPSSPASPVGTSDSRALYSSSGPCRVCGDEAASPHYGSVCCSGCKGFFRRSVRNPMLNSLIYRCSKNQQCQIVKVYRNSCRACRLRKCYAAGLDPMKIHGDRVITLVPKRSFSRRSRKSDEEEYRTDRSCPGAAKKELIEESVELIKKPDVEPDSTTTIAAMPIAGPCSSKAIGLASPRPYSSSPGSISDYDQQIFLASSKKMFEASCSSLPLAAYSGLTLTVDNRTSSFVCNNSAGGSQGNGYQSLGHYFTLVERLCNNFHELAHSHIDPSLSSSANKLISHNLDLHVEEGFLRPRSVIRRTQMNWNARFLVEGRMATRVWCRMYTFYADWASHIPELRLFERRADVTALMASRSTPCIWMWYAHLSIVYGSGDKILTSGGSYFPRDAAAQQLVDAELRSFLQATCNPLIDEIVKVGLSIGVSEEELALLKVLCFCVPVQSLSRQAKEVIRVAQNRYQSALIEVIARTLNRMESGVGISSSLSSSSTTLKLIQRVSTLMSWLSVAERVAQQADNHLSLMTLFNVAKMGGTLPYEIHVRRNG